MPDQVPAARPLEFHWLCFRQAWRRASASGLRDLASLAVSTRGVPPCEVSRDRACRLPAARWYSDVAAIGRSGVGIVARLPEPRLGLRLSASLDRVLYLPW